MYTPLSFDNCQLLAGVVHLHPSFYLPPPRDLMKTNLTYRIISEILEVTFFDDYKHTNERNGMKMKKHLSQNRFWRSGGER